MAGQRLAEHPPVFVVGCGRSGTTMLRLMLDSHPDLAIPGEGHFIPFAYRGRHKHISGGLLDAEGLARKIMRGLHFRRWEVPSELVLDRVRALENPNFASVVEALYMSYAELHGKVRWGDKTPVYVRVIPLLAELFPAAVFIHVIRDGRDVALSYLSVPWGPTSIWQAARKWKKDVSAGRGAAADLGAARYVELRYENLVADPSAELRRLCSFAGLSFEERMLGYHSDAVDRLQAGPGAADYHRSAFAPPTAGLRDWRTQMAPADVESFEAVAGDLLSELGYERRRSVVTRAKRAEVAARGNLLAARTVGSKLKKKLLREGVRRRQPIMEITSPTTTEGRHID